MSKKRTQAAPLTGGQAAVLIVLMLIIGGVISLQKIGTEREVITQEVPDALLSLDSWVVQADDVCLNTVQRLLDQDGIELDQAPADFQVPEAPKVCVKFSESQIQTLGTNIFEVIVPLEVDDKALIPADLLTAEHCLKIDQVLARRQSLYQEEFNRHQLDARVTMTRDQTCTPQEVQNAG